MTTQLTPPQEHADALVAMIRELLPFVGYAANCEDMKKHAYELLGMVDPEAEIKASDSRSSLDFSDLVDDKNYVVRTKIGARYCYYTSVQPHYTWVISEATRLSKADAERIATNYQYDGARPRNAKYEVARV